MGLILNHEITDKITYRTTTSTNLQIIYSIATDSEANELYLNLYDII